MTHDFLLEIGCEEIPADDLPLALDWNYPQGLGLAAASSLLFDQNKIAWKRIQSFGTPRRLVLHASGVESVVREEVEGPPVAIAFDSKGDPTEAAKGFAKRQGVPVAKLKRKKGPRGERLILERTIPVTKILEGILPQILQRISFQKTMRWDDSGVRFVRPIRRLVALYGSQSLSCAFGKVKGETKVYKSAAGYFPVLKRLGVQLEEGKAFRKKENGSMEELPLERKKEKVLQERLRRAAREIGGKLPDETTEEFGWLLNTLTFLSENPLVAAGSFRREYLDLPSEVLATAMAKHLKLMSVSSSDGKALLPKFLAVLEGRPRNLRGVLANYEQILEARFSDARFFYREDTRTPLEKKVPQLAKVIFHEKLGTVAERIPRLERLMTAIAKGIGLQDSLLRLIPRAAQLAKADLVTQMVREFPSLQGIMGGYYSKEAGAPPEVAQAIAEQYKPRTALDPPPRTPLGCLLGLADRLDALTGFFGAGLKPTGSVDPYGLRRQAIGVVRILLSEPGFSFEGLSVDTVLEAGIQSWDSRGSFDPSALKKAIRDFLRERFEWLAATLNAIDRELFDAVIAAGDDDLAGAWKRLGLLTILWRDSKSRQMLIKAAKVAERTSRMVKSVKDAVLPGAVDPAVFKEPLEKQLWQTWSQIAPSLQEQLKRRAYEEATRTYSGLYEPVHSFFEKVFVMDENLELRRNRLAFMREIHEALAGSFADLSKLPLSGIE